MYQRVITPAAKRSLKRLPKDVQDEVLRASLVLTTHPYTGEKLHGSLSFLFSFHFTYHGIHYRVAYTVDDQQQQLIIVYYVGPRENFYDRLRRLFRS